MVSVDSLADPTAIAELDGPPSASTFEPDTIARQAPDLHLTVPGDGGDCAARCSLWWTDTPDYEDHIVGLVGHYAARAQAAGQAVLDRACRRLAEEGCTLAIGPMDGSTWYSYRFVTEHGGRPPFALEPRHPDDYPEHFEDAGFEPLARYVSSIGAELDDGYDPSPARWSLRDGLRARPIDLDNLEEELRRLHTLVTTSFANNFLYKPLSEDDFVALYRPYRAFIDPEFVCLLEQEQSDRIRLVGFGLMVPNALQAMRGDEVDAAVYKTAAVHPDLMGEGLGSWITERLHYKVKARGYQRVIHALMHEDNVSRNLGHGGDVFRQYTLYAQPLSASA